MKNLGYYFKEGSKNMFSHGFMSFAAVGITVACLIIMGTFTLVAYNANVILQDLQKENAVVAFIDENLEETEARALASEVDNIAGISDCTFVSREEARDNYVAQYNENNLYSDLDASIFRNRFVIHLDGSVPMSTVTEQLGQIEGIVKIRADETIANGFTTVRNIARVISLVLIVILLIVSLFIISNTIKLTTMDRRDEIAIMKMVGASNGFIQWPFVFEGLLIGIFGAVIGFGLQWALYRGIANAISASDSLQLISVVDFETIWPTVAVSFGIVGVLVGVGGSLFAIRRFLKV